jgi:hypothetical protein
MDTTVISTIVHELHRVLLDAADGRFPPVDGGVDVAAPMAGDHHAVVEFTGHSFVLTDRDGADVLARGADGFGGASHPDLLRWLAGPDGWIGSHDAVLAARGIGGGRLTVRDDLDDHPRVVRSRDHRRDVAVYGDETGLVTIGRGLVDRLEVSVEVFDGARAGAGRRLIAEALELVPAGEIVFAQVAPGNAASLRAFLSCGFAPIGAETLLLPARN